MKDPIPGVLHDRWQTPAKESKAPVRWWLPSPFVTGKCQNCGALAMGHTDRARQTCCEKCAREPGTCKCAFNEQQKAVADEIPMP